jgi:uncharacterized protein YgbK (DUF1537 family)
MFEIAIIADDLTGALDTGVQFAKNGYNTALQIIGSRCQIASPSKDIEVLIIDAEQRHLSDAMAEEKIIVLVSQIKELSPKYVFVKTDSGLRGPIGGSLAATCRVFEGEHLAFIPSFPALGRVAKGGRYYIQGVLVNESVFGHDPLNPVTITDLKELFDSSVLCAKKGTSGIGLYDCETTEEIATIVSTLLASGVRLFAGCAGLAEVLVAQFKSNVKSPSLPLDNEKPLFLVSGSLNAITQKQLEIAEASGLVRFQLKPEQIFSPAGLDPAIIQEIASELKNSTNIEIDPGISNREQMETYLKDNSIDSQSASSHIVSILAQIVATLHKEGHLREHQLMVIGGDTLLGVLQYLQFRELLPLCELEQGVVYSRLETEIGTVMLISKSGGFGSEQTIQRLMR